MCVRFVYFRGIIAVVRRLRYFGLFFRFFSHGCSFGEACISQSQPTSDEQVVKNIDWRDWLE